MSDGLIATLPRDAVPDRRQRLAACLLLSAIELPAEATFAARALIDAARVCPGVTLAEIPPLGRGSRRAYLERARELIEEMLAECRNMRWPCGHPRTPENTASVGKAGTRCRECRRVISKRAYQCRKVKAK